MTRSVTVTERRARAVRLVLLASVVVTAACGSRATSSPQAHDAAPAAAATVSGTLRVFAAASLTGAFNSAKAPLRATYPGLEVTYNFGGSNTLATQIRQGAPADVFASADPANMQKVVDAGLVEAPVTFAGNRLQIAVAAGNPRGITGLADLAKPGVTVVLAAPGVPAGDYTRQVLAARHITVSARSLETDVKSAVAKVASGEADATVVYATDVAAAGPKVTGIPIADGDQPAITYPIAVVKASRNRAAARAFVQSAVSGDVQRALESAGFVAPQ